MNTKLRILHLILLILVQQNNTVSSSTDYLKNNSDKTLRRNVYMLDMYTNVLGFMLKQARENGNYAFKGSEFKTVTNIFDNILHLRKLVMKEPHDHWYWVTRQG
jgi:hypothetical protein